MNKNILVTAARYSFPHEAELARSSLEAKGITAFVADAHTINMQWLYSNALGGVRVQVYKRNLEAAQAILNTDYSSCVESEVDCDEEPKCSKCGGVLEPYTKGKRPAFVVFILFGFPLFFYQHGLRCTHCGYFTQT
ncbi:putative signal transducing protein [Neptuniibacter marinus]|uniref:DUF2007 domain-containing protein n=1 Tax=Neptuniibacter marinus TaxID=1806670 RepID=UPI00082FBCC2|nr:DUF2007 domain-containing protein [Neptuniibacter marinus]